MRKFFQFRQSKGWDGWSTGAWIGFLALYGVFSNVYALNGEYSYGMANTLGGYVFVTSTGGMSDGSTPINAKFTEAYGGHCYVTASGSASASCSNASGLGLSGNYSKIAASKIPPYGISSLNGLRTTDGGIDHHEWISGSQHDCTLSGTGYAYVYSGLDEFGGLRSDGSFDGVSGWYCSTVNLTGVYVGEKSVIMGSHTSPGIDYCAIRSSDQAVVCSAGASSAASILSGTGYVQLSGFLANGANGYDGVWAVCGLKSNGSAVCGSADGSVGNYSGTGVLVDISLGYNGTNNGSSDFACGKKADNSIVCWGATSLSFPGVPGYVPPTPTPPVVSYVDGMTCYTQQVPDFQSVTYLSGGFMNISGTLSSYVETGKSPIGSLGLSNGDVYTLVNYDSTWSNVDIVKGYNYNSGTVLRDGSFMDPGTTRSTLFPSDYYKPSALQFAAQRDNEPFYGNAYLFFGVANRSDNQPWAYYNPDSNLGHNPEGYLKPVYASGGTAMVVLKNRQTASAIGVYNVAVPPKGFSMVRSDTYSPLTQCSAGHSLCGFDFRGTSVVCAGITDSNGYMGQCGIDSSGRCAPLKDGSGSYLPPVADSGAINSAINIYDGSGNVIGSYTSSSTLQGTNISGSNLFDCSNLPDSWTSWFSCLKQIAGRVVTLISDSSNGAGGKSDASINGNLKKIGTGTGKIDLSPVTSTGVNFGDTLVRKGWNEAMNNDSSFQVIHWARFTFIGSLFLVLVTVILLIASANRKKP